MMKIFYILTAIILTALPLINAASSTTSVEFTNSFDYPFCYFTDIESWWIIDNNWIDSRYNCYRANGFPTSECCPSSESCGEDYKCYIVDSCKDLAEAECDGNIGLATGDLEGIIDGTCGSFYDIYDTSPNCMWYLNCECKWNGTACLASYESLVFNGSRLFNQSQLDDAGGGTEVCEGEDSSDYGECIYDIITTDNCDQLDGSILRSWIAEWTGINPMPSDCINGNDELECINRTRLAFFTLINLIAVVVILFIFYYWYAISKKKRKKKK